MPNIFREIPPIELVEEYMKIFGLRGTQDNTWFSKSCINLQLADEIIPNLEPYYLPCKAKDILHTTLTPGRAITILKQLLTSHDIGLIAKEKTCGRVKGMWYQINPVKLITSIHMDFS